MPYTNYTAFYLDYKKNGGNSIYDTGAYDVFMRWTSEEDRPDAAPVEVNYNGGIANLVVNQKNGGGTSVKIGAWSFTGGSGDYVSIKASDSGYTIADAVKWVPANVGAKKYIIPCRNV